MLEVWDQANLFHVGFYAADEERVGHAESGHESMEGVLEKEKGNVNFSRTCTLSVGHCAYS